MALDEIPVVAELPGTGLTGQAEAVLREIAALLGKLVATGSEGGIDLRSLPLSVEDRAWLRDRLGKGEVSISLDAGGVSCIEETAIAGIWWVEHRNEADELVGEFIEVARVPSLVSVHPDDIQEGLKQLRSVLDI